jgi:hypothetical protein
LQVHFTAPGERLITGNFLTPVAAPKEAIDIAHAARTVSR